MKSVLRENISGKKAIYLTEVEVNRNNNFLYVNFIAHHSTLNSYSNIYNDNLYDADACEIFIFSKTNEYYEIECAPNGTLFFALIHNDGTNRTLKYLDNTAINQKTIPTNDGYTVNLEIDLSKLEGDFTNLKFNLFRIETDGERPNKHLFSLNPTLCPTFHKEDSFILL